MLVKVGLVGFKSGLRGLTFVRMGENFGEA
jgi:hypothetical protein